MRTKRSRTTLCLLGLVFFLPSLGMADNVTIDWFVGGNYPDLDLTLGDTLTFVWNGNHDVYLFADAASFAACNFFGATLVCSSSPCVWSAVVTGDTYLGCRVGSHCASGGMKQRVTVNEASNPPPVPDGDFGVGVTAAKADPTASSIDLDWDASTCPGDDYNVLYGDLADVAALAVTGSFCDLGATGSATWTGVPAGSVWFLLVSDDTSSTEGTWGYDSTSTDRKGTTPSLQCGNATRINTAACP